MSLVAYASSGEDSDGEEDERTTDQTCKELPVKSLETSGVVSSSSDISSSILQSPTHSRFEASTGVICGKVSSLSSFLPPPKFTTRAGEGSTVATKLGENGRPSGTGLDKKLFGSQNIHLGPAFDYNAYDYEEEILEVEEYVPSVKPSKPQEKPKEKDDSLKSVGSLFSLLPPPWKAEGRLQKRAEDESKHVKPKKQIVKIAIPATPELDSDEEVDEPVSKKAKPSKGGSGLSSLLPKPKHSVTVKANPNKPATKLSNRPLIPHTLSKKPAAAKSAPKKGSNSSKNEPEGEISDEDETMSFFSFEERKPDIVPDSSRAVKPSVENTTKAEPAASSESQNLSVVGSSSASVESVSSSSVMRISSSAPAVGSSQSTVSVTPYSEDYCSSSAAGAGYEQYQVTAGTSYAGAADTYGSATGPYNYVTTSEMAATYYGTQVATAGSEYQCSGYGAPAQSSQSGSYSQAEEFSYYGSQAQPVTQPDNIDMEKLKRLQGKRNRGEMINIIDINAQDQIGDAEVVMTKMASEETSYRPTKKKGDMPSSQQRRKHQITYLAHQAKEREFELRNQWSTNRQTKKQTQSKYGF